MPPGPQSIVKEAQNVLSEQILSVERANLNSLVLGDFKDPMTCCFWMLLYKVQIIYCQVHRTTQDWALTFLL